MPTSYPTTIVNVVSSRGTSLNVLNESNCCTAYCDTNAIDRARLYNNAMNGHLVRGA